MIVRKLDSNHDWTFGKGRENYIANQEAISQNIKTRLLSWINDCFFGMQEGIDWANYFDKGQQDNLIYAIKSVILQSDGVIAINTITSELDSARKITISYNIDTIYSQGFTSIITQG